MKKAFFNLPSPSPRPYSQAVKAGDYVFVSGTTGAVNPETGGKVSGIQGQTKQCLDNVKRVPRWMRSLSVPSSLKTKRTSPR
jgi:2-iminobutanoate/2-iminopropanoate deaminase